MTPFGRIIGFHKRYSIGDEHTEPHEKDPQVFKEWIAQKMKSGEILSMPVYLMDHSSLTLSTSCENFRAVDPNGWDWGLLGWTYITRAELREELKKKRLSPQDEARAYATLRHEVSMYNEYMNGEVYGFIITDGAGKEIDDGAIWGFLGSDDKYMLEEARGIIDRHLKNTSKPILADGRKRPSNG